MPPIMRAMVTTGQMDVNVREEATTLTTPVARRRTAALTRKMRVSTNQTST